jgi:4-amino-4-deoxy-L-arabinose transferase-like glycosyltransferase
MTQLGHNHLSPAGQRILWLILLITLVLRIGILFINYQADPQRIMAKDSGSYLGPARALLAHGKFSQSPAAPDMPELVRTPVYPAFIAAVEFFSGPNPQAIAVTQVVLSLFTLAAAFFMARAIWGSPAASFGVVLLALDLSGFLFSQQLLSESLFTLLLTLAALFGTRLLLQGRGVGSAFGLGLFLGLATLTRPVSYYLLPVLALFVLFALWRARRSFIIALGLVVVMLVPMVITVGGWQYRNYRVAGVSGLSNIVGENLLKYWAAEVVAMRDGITRLEAENKLLDELGRPQEKGLPPDEVMRIYKEKSLQVMKSHPGLVIKGMVRGALTMLLVPLVPDVMSYLGQKPDSGPIGDILRLPWRDWAGKWLGHRPWELAAHLGALIYLIFIYLGALFSLGLILRGGGQAWAQALLWLIIIYIIGIALGPSAYGRLRAPVMPLLCMAAGAGWSWLSGRKPQSSW